MFYLNYDPVKPIADRFLQDNLFVQLSGRIFQVGTILLTFKSKWLLFPEFKKS